ncbi:Hypothetical predicted protein [Pelobates cultripes]|uniref:Uncharacterized protein n=1 Tax=Pelobates cultripes TaxID=61616 RepID=A0AAD1R6A2_PELCU|nr:Hypothetical predicted protein [Pelobates cultripes]
MAEPYRQPPAQKAHTMEDTMCGHDGCGGETATMTRLTAILYTFLAKLETRERQAKARRNLPRECPTGIRHSRAKPPLNSQQTKMAPKTETSPVCQEAFIQSGDTSPRGPTESRSLPHDIKHRSATSEWQTLTWCRSTTQPRGTIESQTSTPHTCTVISGTHSNEQTFPPQLDLPLRDPHASPTHLPLLSIG